MSLKKLKHQLVLSLILFLLTATLVMSAETSNKNDSKCAGTRPMIICSDGSNACFCENGFWNCKPCPPTTTIPKCPERECFWDPCPGKHIPDENGCVDCASPCSEPSTTTTTIQCCPPCPPGAACAPCPTGWPPCSKIPCKTNLDCPSQMRCENSVCVDVGCVKEGGTIPGAISPEYRNHMPTKCCEGLKTIAYSGYFDKKCNRVPLAGAPSGVCSKCGNGICESWETKCTCPEDCSIPTTTTTLPPIDDWIKCERINLLNWRCYSDYFKVTCKPGNFWDNIMDIITKGKTSWICSIAPRIQE